VTKCERFGGRCENPTCTECCSAECKVCGGPNCASDPAGADKCCPDQIRVSGRACTDGSVAAPCTRASMCDAHGGVCSDGLCSVCCDPKCSACLSVCSALEPVGTGCCVENLKAAALCGPGVPAPCLRVKPEEEEDDDSSLLIVVIILAVLLCCCAVLLLLYLKHRKQVQEEDRMNKQFTQEEKLTGVGIGGAAVMAAEEEMVESKPLSGVSNASRAGRSARLMDQSTTSMSARTRTGGSPDTSRPRRGKPGGKCGRAAQSSMRSTCDTPRQEDSPSVSP